MSFTDIKHTFYIDELWVNSEYSALHEKRSNVMVYHSYGENEPFEQEPEHEYIGNEVLETECGGIKFDLVDETPVDLTEFYQLHPPEAYELTTRIIDLEENTEPLFQEEFNEGPIPRGRYGLRVIGTRIETTKVEPLSPEDEEDFDSDDDLP